MNSANSFKKGDIVKASVQVKNLEMNKLYQVIYVYGDRVVVEDEFQRQHDIWYGWFNLAKREDKPLTKFECLELD